MNHDSCRRRLVLWVLFLIGTITLMPLYTRADNRNFQPDYWPTDEWSSTIPELQQMASGSLIAMQSYIEENDLPLDSVLVVRNGYIVYELYPRGFQVDSFIFSIR